MVVALGLTMGLLMLVAATQMQAVQQLKVSRTNRHYERALQNAEAGLNAYVNMLSNGPGSGPNAASVPPFGSVNAPTLAQFSADVRAGNITLTPYPAGSPTTGLNASGFYVGHVGTPGATVDIFSYGYFRGTARRVRGSGLAFSIFDWAALWGMRPSGGVAWRVTGDAKVVGAAGGEGNMQWSNNNVFYDGPLVMAGPNASWTDGSNNTSTDFTRAPGPPRYDEILHEWFFNNSADRSKPDVPTGHLGDGTVASPWFREFRARTIGLPTADEAANEWGGGTTGVEQFRSNNHNATGLRYLVQHKTTGVIRELNDPDLPYTIADASNDYRLEWPPGRSTYTALGMTSEEDPYGIRVYPGNYYFTRVNMGPSDKLLLRTYNDADRSDPIVQSLRPFVVDGDPPNPNGLADERNIRFWIGHASIGSDQQTRFEKGTTMEYPNVASRFRIYNANSGGVLVRGSASGPPFFFNVNLLSYNRASNGTYYGTVDFTSSVYLRGSLLAWTVDVSGSTTIEKQAPELGPDDRLTYVIDSWTELDE